MKKKLLALFLSAAVLLCASCGTQTAETVENTAQTTQAPAETTVADTAETTAADTTTAKETAAPSDTDTDAAKTTAAPETDEHAEAAKAFYDGELSPAVWKATDPESGNSLYLMGTIHIVPDTDETVPQYVMDIYNGADGVAVEYDTSKISADLVIQLKYLSYYTLSDGTVITDHLSAETYERAKKYLTEQGLYNESFDAYNAAYWESLITSASILNIPGMRASGVDSYFIALAKSEGKEVRSIETLDTQMNVLTMLSDQMYDWTISEMLTELEDDPQSVEDALRSLYKYWATGDASGFMESEESDEEEVPEEFAEEYAAYENALTAQRNVGMAEKAAEYIKNGDNVFFMVGFAHFCGEESVLKNLEQMGFSVEQVY